MARRSRLDIIGDILMFLSSKQKGAKPTHVMYKSNLSHKQMQGYLKSLEEKGFIVRDKSKGSEVISITDAGREFAADRRHDS